jgi:hypothetical protein
MSSYNVNSDVSGPGHRGGWFCGDGGIGAGGILIGVIVLWLLFGHGRGFGFGGNHEGGHGGHHGGCANIHATRPGYYDESNYEEERNLIREQNEHDRRQTAEQTKTRELIEKLDREALRDKLAEKDTIIARQASEAFSLALFGRLEGQIAALSCGLPKARPQYACTVTPCLGELPSCGEPRRGSCGEFE